MNMTGIGPERVITLATLLFLSAYLPSIAAEFSPLDVWEEMEAWEVKLAASLGLEAAGSIETMQDVDAAEMAHASTTFDVWKGMGDLSGIRWRNWKGGKAFNLNDGGLTEDASNPYWMPDAFRTP